MYYNHGCCGPATSIFKKVHIGLESKVKLRQLKEVTVSHQHILKSTRWPRITS